MLAIGDKVKVVGCLEKEHIGKTGKVVRITTGFEPKEQDELRYIVELDDGAVIHSIIEHRLLEQLEDFRNEKHLWYKALEREGDFPLKRRLRLLFNTSISKGMT